MPPQPVYCSENNLFRVRAGYDDLKRPPYDSSRAGRGRVGQAGWLLQNFSPPGTFSFVCQKRTRKAPATFEAREAAGCGSLRLLCALRGTRILQAAVPTAPPCFGHWPRSSPLQTRGCSPLVTPKLLGSIQKIQVASLKDFLCSADWKPLSRCATAPSKREPLAKPESVMVCPETLPSCQGLSLWESWQAR